MTHLWKSEETYTFDMPICRIENVYTKNAYWPLAPYLKFYNPKISKVEFDATMPGVHITVPIPKYPKTRPQFNDVDVKTLLESYMKYANFTNEEIKAWYEVNKRKDSDES